MNRKKIRKAVAVILAAVMVLMFNGCAMIMDITTSVKKNGSGEITFTIGFDEDLWTMVTSEGVDSSMEDYEEIDYNGEKIHGISESKSFKSYEELNEIMNEGNPMQSAMSGIGETTESSDGGSLFTTFEASKKGINAVIDSKGLGFGEDMESMREAGVVFKFPLNFTFEDEVIEANGKISEDKHTVTYDLLSDKEISIKLKNQNPLLIIAAIIVAVAIIAVFVISGRKKKASAENASAENATAENAAIEGEAAGEEAAGEETAEVEEADTGAQLQENTEAAEVPVGETYAETGEAVKETEEA